MPVTLVAVYRVLLEQWAETAVAFPFHTAVSLLYGIVLWVPQGFQGFPRQSLSGAPPRGDGMPKGHLVQTANLFDALFVFNSSFLFTRAQPTVVGILSEGTQSTREREKNHSLWVCGF